MQLALTRAEDVLLLVVFVDVEDVFFVGDLLPDGEGEAVSAVPRVQDAIVILMTESRFDQTLRQAIEGKKNIIFREKKWQFLASC